MRRKGLRAAARHSLASLMALLALTVLMLAAGARAQEVSTLALPGGALYPEGILALENGNLFITGFGNGSILKVTDGEVEGFKEPGEDGLSSAVGLAADEARNRLWVANFSFDGFTSDLKVYDLTSGELLASLADPDDDPHFFNEIALAEDGRVYVSDTAAPVIWTADPELQGVEVFVQDDLLMNPDPERAFGLNGLALTPDGDYLVASVMDRIDQGGGRLVRVDLETKEVTDVELSGDAVETFGGSDGMFFHGDSLLMVNVTPPASVVSAVFAEDYSSAELTSHDAFEEVYNRPTSSAVRDGRLWTVNSQLDHIIDDENGALNTPPELPFELVGVPLGELLEQRSSPVAEGATPILYADGFEFTEGPLWTGDGLLVSDIYANAIYEVSEGNAEVWLEPSGRANGILQNAEGDIIVAQHHRAISRINGGGELEVLAERYEGSRLNSPNDLALHSSGALYFTDPPFGLSGPPLGAEGQEAELDFSGIYRLEDGSVTLLADNLAAPNGLAFSPDESRLYVNDSATQSTWVYDVAENGGLGNGRMFYQFDTALEGFADGLKVDAAGNLITTAPGGLVVLSPSAEVLTTVPLPQVATNVAFGGPDGNTLFITAGTAVYTLPLEP